MSETRIAVLMDRNSWSQIVDDLCDHYGGDAWMTEVFESVEVFEVPDNAEQHLIQFRDGGWTIQHPLTERLEGSLFECQRANWTHGDPGVRGSFVLNDDGELGEQI